tara:strand:+ start:1429 stop:1668 length:240 start_codon:yes stop_codon:yes gene_type:complete
MNDDELLKIDGFDDAIIGVQESIERKLVYDIDKIAEILMTREQMTEEDSYDYISYNITSAYVGEKTPILVKVGKLEDFI